MNLNTPFVAYKEYNMRIIINKLQEIYMNFNRQKLNLIKYLQMALK